MTDSTATPTCRRAPVAEAAWVAAAERLHLVVVVAPALASRQVVVAVAVAAVEAARPAAVDRTTWPHQDIAAAVAGVGRLGE